MGHVLLLLVRVKLIVFIFTGLLVFGVHFLHWVLITVVLIGPVFLLSIVVRLSCVSLLLLNLLLLLIIDLLIVFLFFISHAPASRATLEHQIR